MCGRLQPYLSQAATVSAAGCNHTCLGCSHMCAAGMPDICPGMPEICPRYARDMPEICPGMPEMLMPGGALIGCGLGKDVALVTDGRFSGAPHAAHTVCIAFVALHFARAMHAMLVLMAVQCITRHNAPCILRVSTPTAQSHPTGSSSHVYVQAHPTGSWWAMSPPRRRWVGRLRWSATATSSHLTRR